MSVARLFVLRDDGGVRTFARVATVTRKALMGNRRGDRV